VDKSFPLGFCAGSRVFNCDNLCFRSELLVRKKHTRHGEQRFTQAIAEAVAELASFKEEETRRVTLLRLTDVSDERAESVILRAWERGIIDARHLPEVLKEWRKPSYVDFQGGSHKKPVTSPCHLWSRSTFGLVAGVEVLGLLVV
jgi:hypothetical protein